MNRCSWLTLCLWRTKEVYASIFKTSSNPASVNFALMLFQSSINVTLMSVINLRETGLRFPPLLHSRFPLALPFSFQLERQFEVLLVGLLLDGMPFLGCGRIPAV